MLALLASALQLGNRTYAQSFIERLNLLGTKALQFEEHENLRRKGVAKVIVVIELSRLRQSRDLVGDGLANALNLRRRSSAISLAKSSPMVSSARAALT